jgi:hypothetical protein
MTEPSQPDTDSSTPIPWHAEGLYIYHDHPDSSTEFDNIARYVKEEDAILTVRAVNNHAKLLKALKKRHSHIERWHSEDATGEGRRCTACIEYECQARAAIEEAQS